MDISVGVFSDKLENTSSGGFCQIIGGPEKDRFKGVEDGCVV